MLLMYSVSADCHCFFKILKIKQSPSVELILDSNEHVIEVNGVLKFIYFDTHPMSRLSAPLLKLTLVGKSSIRKSKLRRDINPISHFEGRILGSATFYHYFVSFGSLWIRNCSGKLFITTALDY